MRHVSTAIGVLVILLVMCPVAASPGASISNPELVHLRLNKDK